MSILLSNSLNGLVYFSLTTLFIKELQIFICLKFDIQRQFIIPTFEEEGYFTLKPFDLVEDLHNRYMRSIIGISVNWLDILKIKRSYLTLLYSRDSNLNKAKRLKYDF